MMMMMTMSASSSHGFVTYTSQLPLAMNALANCAFRCAAHTVWNSLKIDIIHVNSCSLNVLKSIQIIG